MMEIEACSEFYENQVTMIAYNLEVIGGADKCNWEFFQIHMIIC
jgi:hypothetical protein